MTFDHPRLRAAALPAARIVLLLALSAWGPSVWAQATATDDLRAEIEALRAEQGRIADRQRQIDAKLDELEARSGAQPASTARGVAAAAKHNAAQVPGVDAKSRLTVTGDMRLRYQGDYADEGARERDSSQVRARLGATYAATDRVTLGARLVTGDPDDPNSTDVQLSNFDDDLQVSLDLAYAQLKLGDLNLFGGTVPQPFARTDLVWDSDVNPQGVSAVYKHPMSGGALRANGIFFVVDEDAVGPDSTMVGAQLGYDSAAFGDWQVDASAAYYDYRLGSIVGGDAGDFRSNLRNPDGSYRSDFDLGDLLVGVTWSGAGERWPVRVLGDYVHNFGAATSADTGYGVDIIAGRASKESDWRLTYGYSIAETDAVLAAFSHDNIGIATNYKLHALTLDYMPWPKTLLSAIWYHYRPDHAIDAGANDPSDWLDRLRIAFLVSF